jgi:hypothetical protein
MGCTGALAMFVLSACVVSVCVDVCVVCFASAQSRGQAYQRRSCLSSVVQGVT